jgi:uncharacterized membrane protein YbhN (UPF0104 family)
MKTDTKTHPAFPVVQIGRYVLPLIVLGIAVHVLVPQLTNLEHSLNVLRQMAWWAVALAIIAQVLS